MERFKEYAEIETVTLNYSADIESQVCYTDALAGATKYSGMTSFSVKIPKNSLVILWAYGTSSYVLGGDILYEQTGYYGGMYIVKATSNLVLYGGHEIRFVVG